MSEPKPPAGEPEDFATLFAESEAKRGGNPHKRRDPKEGDSVRGKIVSIGRDTAFVDIGAKSDGVLELIELRDEHGAVGAAVGDEIEARVVEIDGKAGAIVLRRSLGRGRGVDASRELSDAQAHQIPVEGMVTGVNKGGLEVQVAGVRGFCPMSQIELRPITTLDAAALVGRKLAFRVTRYEDGPRPNVVLSRRALLEEENAERAVVTRERLAVGAILRGRVVALKEFGAFVDLGGLEGLIHNSELGYDRGANATGVLSVGQELEVAVVRIEPDPKTGKERIALSLRALMADPWQDAAARLGEGATVEGKVARLEAFGAFVELTPGVEGLLHLSELEKSGKRVRHPKDVLTVGQPVRVTVLGVEGERRRISLGLADERDTGDDGGPAPAPGAPARFGTFADLLKDKKR